MHVDVADAASHESVPLDEGEHLGLGGGWCGGKIAEQRQYLGSVREVAARKLPDDVRMAQHTTTLESIDQDWIRHAKVVDPNGGIYQDHG